MSQEPPPYATTTLGETVDASGNAFASLPLNRPARIGPYRILEQLGEGGMGVVYLAEQEQPIRRRVAVKLIKLGMDTHQVVARFEAERQALALMEHPHIASVIDAGATEDGRPFFVMEYVHGVPITTFCDRRQLPLRDRLTLFQQVCGAIQHAHQKGVIHRDLKPSNILVVEQDGRPVPKVIDFGIAKATDQALTERTLFTEQGSLIGTPEYMSPEQAEGTVDIDTRTDIYSLGVVLYELLAGAVPFDTATLRRAGYGEMLRIIREREPARPSERTTLSTLVREIRGDLDWITLKALEKDRTRRYASASELANDIGRYLDDEPIEARPPSVAYRARKFVRRYRGPVAAAAALFVTLVAGLVVSVTLYFRADRSRRDADEQRGIAAEQRTAADASAADARHERDAANEQRQAAEAANRLAQTERQTAERERDESAHQSYRSLVLAADLSMRQSDSGEALRLLDQAGTNLRSWEWHYLRRAADASLQRHSLIGQVRDVAFRPSTGDILAAVDVAPSPALPEGFSFVSAAIAPPPALPTLTETRLTSFVALSPDGRFAVAAPFSWRSTGSTCGLLPPAYRPPPCHPLWNPTPQDQLGAVLTPEERDRLIVIDTTSRTPVATLRHAGLGVWTGQGLSQAIIPRPLPSRSRAIVRLPGDSRNVATLTGRFPDVVAAVFSRDSSRLASWSWDNVIRVWSVATQAELSTFSGHRDAILSAAFTDDGKELVSGSLDGTVRIWSVASGQELDSLRVNAISAVAINGAGTRVAVGTEAGALQIWRRGTAATAASLPTQPGAITQLAFNPSSTMLASSSADDLSIGLWDPETGADLGRLPGHSDRVLTLAWHPDGRRLASGSGGGERGVRVWDITDSKPKLVLRTPTTNVATVAFAKNGGQLMSAAADGLLRIWDEIRAQPVRTVNLDAEPGQRAARAFVQIGASRRHLFVPYDARGRTTVHVVDLETGATTARLPAEDTVMGVEENAAGTVVAVAARGPTADTVHVWDARSGRSIATLPIGAATRVEEIALSPVANLIAVSVATSSPPSILLFDSGSGRPVRTIPAQSFSESGCLTFTPDGAKLLGCVSTSAPDGGVAVWDAHTGERLAIMQAHDGPVTSVAVSADGRRVLTAGRDRTVRLWNAARYDLLLTLRTESVVGPIAFSADGRRIAAGTAEGAVYVWNAGSSER